MEANASQKCNPDNKGRTFLQLRREHEGDPRPNLLPFALHTGGVRIGWSELIRPWFNN